MIINETSERNDSNNWVKANLLNDDFHIISFEGYTVKGGLTTALFDRRQFQHEKFEDLSEDELEALISHEEPYIGAKLAFAKSLKVNYFYVFYRYNPQNIVLYRFGGEVFFSLPANNDQNNGLVYKPRHIESKIFKFRDFCSFIDSTKHIRDLTMASNYEERGLPQIDQIFRRNCNYAWMGNLDGLFLTNANGKPKAIIEWQTTKKTSVENHCNNTWFAPTPRRKGDEQRWRVMHNISLQSQLPLIIIVWSPNEVNGNIKYKVVSDVIYSDSANNKYAKPGLVYKEKSLIHYNELKLKLEALANS